MTKPKKEQPKLTIVESWSGGPALHTLYVFVRTDMPSMNPGKAQAHSGHAASLFARDALRDMLPLAPTGYGPRVYKEWCGDRGFGTQINLKAPWDEVANMIEVNQTMGAVPLCGLVIDPTYPYFVDKEIFGLIPKDVHSAEPIFKENGVVCFRKEATAAYVFCEETNTPLKESLSVYPLHP